MSHGSETRRMRGGDTGVKGRRSREGAGLGKQIQADHMQGNPPKEAVKKLEGFWNRLSHEWLGTDKSSFPYNMGKWDKDKGQGSSMITTPSSRKEAMPRSTRSTDDRSPPSEPPTPIKPHRQESSYSPPANYHPSGVRMTDAEAYAQEDWNQRKNRNHKPYVDAYNFGRK